MSSSVMYMGIFKPVCSVFIEFFKLVAVISVTSCD